MPPVTARDSVKGAFYAPRPWLQTYKTTFAITLKESEKTPKYRNYMKRENLNLVCPAKCHPLQLETPERARCTPLGVDLKLETPERARFTPLGHSYKSETEHFYDNFKGIRENSEIPKLHEKGKPKSCMSCQMPPVTVRDSGKGALYAPRCGLESLETPERARFTPLGHSYKSETEHFCDNFKGIRENSEIPKLHEKGNLNLVCPAKCHPLQLETPERARCTPLGVDLKLETPEGRVYAPSHSYKVKRSTFAITLKESEENSEIPKLHEKGKPKSCMSCQMPPVTVRDSGKGALYAPRCGLETRDSGKGAFYAPRPWLQTYKTTFAITLKESEKTPKYRNYMKRENLNLVCPAKCHPLQLETPERARCTPLGVDLKVYNQL
ncbi:hypothetical protein Fcan01_28574 [Folsomia candida]|uniref:Uncharacterized protein n=1 Tax=Folsomia candida TaxID=158441 RepID=A0A226CV84_FOLCA|nr:hypothetical protein Fcan01_28574 [Folsomia candida]